MRTYSDDLFQLIKSLTAAEKRIFKLNVSNNSGEKKYLKLFDAIDSQKEYDEAKIRKKFINEQFIIQLTTIKNYLYNSILNSIVLYRSNTDAQLRDMLNKIETLYERDILLPAERLILKGKELAYKNEKFHFLIELIDWEKLVKKAINKLSEDFKRICEEESIILNKQKNVKEYKQLWQNVSFFSNKNRDIRALGVRKLKEEVIVYFKNPLLANENKALSISAKKYFFIVSAILERLKGDINTSTVFFRKYFDLMDAFPYQINEDPLNYAKELNDYIAGCTALKNFDESVNGLVKMRSLSILDINTPIKEKLNRLVFEQSYNLELSLYLKQNRYEKALTIIKDVENGFTIYKEKLDTGYKINLMAKMAFVYFANAQYKKSQFWINHILNDSYQVRPELYCFAKVLNLLIHFELGNTEFLEYTAKSTEYFLDKKSRLYKLETVVLSFIKSTVKSFTPNKFNPLFIKFKKDLSILAVDTNEGQLLVYFDFISWVESKIQKKSFLEYMKEKNVS